MTILTEEEQKLALYLGDRWWGVEKIRQEIWERRETEMGGSMSLEISKILAGRHSGKR